MCKAKKYAEQLLDIYNKINEDHQNLCNELSQIDLSQQVILHKIENDKFNACEGYMFSKELQDIRVKRRNVKNELGSLSSLKHSFTDANIKELNLTYQNVIKINDNFIKAMKDKTYKPKIKDTNIVKPTIVVNNTDNNIGNSKTDSEKLYYKKTGQEIEILSKLSENAYYVKIIKNKYKCILKSKDIINIEKLQIAN